MELRALGIGCNVAGTYMGAVGFCDDLLLLPPTRDGMQVMLNTCERFAAKYNLIQPSQKQDKVYLCMWTIQEQTEASTSSAEWETASLVGDLSPL